MLTRMIESNKAIRQMQQTHQQCRARAKRQRKTQLAKKGATESIACIKRWKMKVQGRGSGTMGFGKLLRNEMGHLRRKGGRGKAGS